MARKLKTYQTSLGFFEQAIAAPSAGAGLRGSAQESVNQPRFVAKKICADLLKLFPGLQIFSASP